MKLEKHALKGRCVIATKEYKIGDFVCADPVLILNEQDSKIIQNTKLFSYDYFWTETCSCIVFGYGSMFNHSSDPNVKFIKDYENNLMRYEAIKNINIGDEMYIDYNGDALEKTPIWFKVI